MSSFSFLINSYCEAKLSLRVSAALMSDCFIRAPLGVSISTYMNYV